MKIDERAGDFFLVEEEDVYLYLRGRTSLPKTRPGNEHKATASCIGERKRGSLHMF